MDDLLLMLPWFLVASTLVLLVFLGIAGLKQSPKGAASAPSRAHPAGPLRSARPTASASARQTATDQATAERMIQAGLYGPQAPTVFVVTKVVLAGCMVALGLGFASLGFLPLPIALVIGLLCGIVGTIAPSFWLDHVRRKRQKQIRRSLPDALDVVGICMEGGLSLSAAIVRVARELGAAHPLLASELAIVERETQLGMTNGEALRQFANRFDLEELRSLSSVVKHSEKLGGSITKAFAVYSATLRTTRRQKAEEMAQKAAVKIIFPTAFCIFPGLFIVILGPAAIQIYTVLFRIGAG